MHKRLENEFNFLKKLNIHKNATIETKRACFEHLLLVFTGIYDQVHVEINTYGCIAYKSKVKFTHKGVVNSYNDFELNYIEMDDVVEGSRRLFEYVIEKFELEKEPEKKTCGNCKHRNKNPAETPCLGCWFNDNWEPEEKEEPKKVYTTTGWDRHVDTDVASMYPKFEFTFDASYVSRNIGMIDELCKSRLHKKQTLPEIRDVIFNDPATIVFWADGTKTVVRCQDGEEYDPEKGLAMAISKKALGNTREYYHTFLHELKKVKKNSESVKMLEIGKSIRNGIAKGIADYLEYQGVLPKEKEDK